MAKAPAHKWTFRARFRRHAYGWKSQPAIKRIREAVSEIKREARKDPLLAAEGAVLFLITLLHLEGVFHLGHRLAGQRRLVDDQLHSFY